MIRIFNKECFDVKVYISEEYLLFNLILKPEDIDSTLMNADPFCTIVFKGKDLTSKPLSQYDDSPCKKNKIFTDLMQTVALMYETEVINAYEDPRYYEITSIFEDLLPEETDFPRSLLFVDSTTPKLSAPSSKNFLVGATWIRGTMRPIPKSPNYTILNGAFVVPNITPESLANPSGIYYLTTTKIFCFVVDIHIDFTIYDAIISDTDPNHIIVMQDVFRAGVGTITYEEKRLELAKKGREEFLKKVPGSLFHIKDIPKGVSIGEDVVRDI